MSEITSPDVIDFIRENSTASSLRNSYELYPILKDIGENFAIYDCKGSLRLPYTIHISTLNHKIKVNCTCPYDYGGICKHAIASLENFALTLKDGESSTEKRSSVPIKKTIVVEPVERKNKILSFPLHADGADEEAIFKELSDYKDYYNTQDHIRFSKIELNEIQTIISDWRTSVTQTFKADYEKGVLEMKCSCSDKKKGSYCTHLFSAFQKIIKIFGSAFFRIDYKEYKIENFLKDYGLDLDDPYRKYFDFSLDENGFRGVSKFPELQKISKPFESEISSELQDRKQRLKHIAETSKTGEGLIFEFNNNDFQRFTAVHAKYNKEGTELATHFKEVHLYRIDSMMNQYSDAGLMMFLSAFKTNDLLVSFYHKKSADRLENLMQGFAKLIKMIGEHPLYSHQSYTTYARKNLQQLFIKNDVPLMSH